MVDFQERDTRIDSDDADGERGEEDGDASANDDDHAQQHGHHGQDVETLGAGVVTVSSSRTVDDDPSGDAICAAFRENGHEIVIRELVADDHDRIQRIVDNISERSDVDVIVTTGGTGVTPDDVTVEAVRSLFRKELPGFGELFRRRSEAEIGTRVVATRATAGIVTSVPVFCLPGSEDAATTGVELVLAEAGHIAGLARRGHE